MRLYEVASQGGVPIAFVKTDETFKSTADFITHAKKHGDKYAGKTWVLLSERTEPKPITVKEKTQYEIEIS